MAQRRPAHLGPPSLQGQFLGSAELLLAGQLAGKVKSRLVLVSLAFVWVSEIVMLARGVLECRCRLESCCIGTASPAGKAGRLGSAAST